MKKILLATSVLAATTGFAAAEVTVSGDARMGILQGFSDDPLTPTFDESTAHFTSRARVKFSMVGTTDGGVEFGASFRANDAAGAKAGTAGEVYVSSNGFKVTMGDVDGAANAAVGHVSGVGLTGLGDLNESTFIANGDGDLGQDPSVLIEYTSGAITGYFSATNPGAFTADKYAIGGKYATDVFSVALGYEDNGLGTTHVIVGGSYTTGPVTLKARYGSATGSLTQYALSADYVAGATTVTAFYTDDSEVGGAKAYGLGAAYDLGGGASIIGGYAKNQDSGEDSMDLGISMSF
jgi:outer membrane protein OmpU